MKLLSTVGTTLEFSTINEYTSFTKTSTLTVWSVDGNLTYFSFPHVLLFTVGLAVMLFLWMLYTFILLSMQWLRRLSEAFNSSVGLPSFILSTWCLLCSFEARHQLVFVQCSFTCLWNLILIMFASTSNIFHSTNLLLLLIILSFYIIVGQPYRSPAVQIIQTSFFINLTLLSAFSIHNFNTNQPTIQTIAVSTSVGGDFIQFCGIMLHVLISVLYSSLKADWMLQLWYKR